MRCRKKRETESGHYEALDHLGGVELHGDLDVFLNRLEPYIQPRPGCPGFRQQQRKAIQVTGENILLGSDWMLGGAQELNLVRVNLGHLETLLLYRQLRNAEIGA